MPQASPGTTLKEKYLALMQASDAHCCCYPQGNTYYLPSFRNSYPAFATHEIPVIHLL